MGPFSPRLTECKAVELHSLRRKQRGRGPGSLSRPAPPHSAAGRGLNRFDVLRRGAGPRVCVPPSAPLCFPATRWCGRPPKRYHRELACQGARSVVRVVARRLRGSWGRARHRRGCRSL